MLASKNYSCKCEEKKGGKEAMCLQHVVRTQHLSIQENLSVSIVTKASFPFMI